MLLITPGFAADDSDDTCIPPLQLLVRGLLEQGEKVEVIALEYPFRSSSYRWHGADIHPCAGANRKWLRWRTETRALACARTLIGAGGVTALHSFWLGHAWQIGQQLAAQFQLPHFTTLMGQDVLMAVNRRYLQRLTTGNAANLIALSDFHAQQLAINTGIRPGHIIPWGIEKGEFFNLQPVGHDIDILGVGSLLPVKNWEMWVRTIALVVARMPGLNAVLAGDGPDKAQIAASIKRLGLSQHIHLTGNLPRSEILRLMASAKMLLHTARFESYGYVFAEAAAAGCRVVSTPVGIAASVGETAEVEAGLADLVLKGLAANDRFSRMPFLMEDTVAAYRSLHD